MRVLGISASPRKWGNTDILIHHALKGAKAEGAEIRFVRLEDLEIHQCKECFSCLFKENDCTQKDQFPEFLKELRWSDGLVLGSPIHILFAAGVLQTVTPRLFRQGYTGEFTGKPGIAISVGGRPGWEGWALQQVMIFFLFLGMRIIDQFVGYGQGPGEVFDDREACKRAFEDGKTLAMGETVFRGSPGICPVCHGDIMLTGQGDNPRCMICNLPGQWAGNGKFDKFIPLQDSRSRWDIHENRKHFENVILPSGQGFTNRKDEIKEKIRKFRESIT